MSISFSCICGKSFTVRDDLAGRRTKCPACAAALTVPAPPPEAMAEDDAFQMLEAAGTPEKADRPPRHDWGGQVEPAASLPPPPAGARPSSKSTPPAKKRGPSYQNRDAAERRERSGPRISISPGMAGGLASMAIAAVWFTVGLAADRIFIYPPIMFLFGLVAVVKGVLGHPED